MEVLESELDYTKCPSVQKQKDSRSKTVDGSYFYSSLTECTAKLFISSQWMTKVTLPFPLMNDSSIITFVFYLAAALKSVIMRVFLTRS